MRAGRAGRGDAAPRSISVTILDDDLAESSDSLAAILSNATGGAVIGDYSSFSINILDQDVAANGLLGFDGFACCSLFVDENDAQTLTLTVTRSGGNEGTVSVDYWFAGSAEAGVDYDATPDTLSWADGDAAPRSISVTILDDDLAESSESLAAILSNATGGAVIGDYSSFSISILDQDGLAHGQVEFDSDTATTEGAGSVALQVLRLAGSDGMITVDYATADGSALAGEDYVAQSGTLTWADGDASPKSIVITLIDDLAVESDEAFGLTLSDPGGGATLGTQALAMVLLIDDDDGLHIFRSGFEPPFP
jgi:hypothetical protein